MTQEAALSTEVWKEHNLNGADSEGGRQNGGDAEASIIDIKHSPPAQHVIVPDPPGTGSLCIHHRLSPITCLLRTVAGLLLSSHYFGILGICLPRLGVAVYSNLSVRSTQTI